MIYIGNTRTQYFHWEMFYVRINLFIFLALIMNVIRLAQIANLRRIKELAHNAQIYRFLTVGSYGVYATFDVQFQR